MLIKKTIWRMLSKFDLINMFTFFFTKVLCLLDDVDTLMNEGRRGRRQKWDPPILAPSPPHLPIPPPLVEYDYVYLKIIILINLYRFAAPHDSIFQLILLCGVKLALNST